MYEYRGNTSMHTKSGILIIEGYLDTHELPIVIAARPMRVVMHIIPQMILYIFCD